MATKERFQNPNINDTVRLRLLTFNANNMANVNSFDKIEIWSIDPSDPQNVNLRNLVLTVDGDDVVQESTGNYYVDVTLDEQFCVGPYVDIWSVNFELQENELCEPAIIEQFFEIHRQIWFTSPSPLVYDFSFSFRPNKLVHGTKQYLIVNVRPNVPTASALQDYYMNLAVVSPIRISIAQRCGDCVPAEEDLRLVVDCELVELREKCLGYYFLDTSDLDKGIYDVWFQMEFGNSTHISPKSQLQIF